jgi:Domain of unknown function (DUF4148)
MGLPLYQPVKHLESKMKKLAMFTLSAAVLLSSGAFAQGLTRAEVRQQLVEAQQNGSQYVTNASYPDVSPVFQGQVARLQKNDVTSYGGVAAGSSAVRAAMPMVPSHEPCVGPYSFCNIYAGS